MNTYQKYCPNVFVAKCDEKHDKGEIITVTTKEHIDIYLQEAKSKDYNHLLYVSFKMIDELNEKYL